VSQAEGRKRWVTPSGLSEGPELTTSSGQDYLPTQPSRPTERGLTGAALLAHVLLSKHADHQPLYRQAEMNARERVDLDREGGIIYEVACWAHTRRKLYNIHAIHPLPIITEAIDRIGTLYGIEEQIRGKTADLRLDVRQT
jgi:hypothetical protein